MLVITKALPAKSLSDSKDLISSAISSAMFGRQCRVREKLKGFYRRVRARSRPERFRCSATTSSRIKRTLIATQIKADAANHRIANMNVALATATPIKNTKTLNAAVPMRRGGVTTGPCATNDISTS